MFKPRPLQSKVLKFRRGKMGVSAVPGSGKTQTLSALAAQLISENAINEEQEILVVTLVNSAVNNFSQRIEGFIENAGLLPGFGYRVRTLHGLAHDIIRERPDLVGLSNQFTIIDERDASDILDSLSSTWLRVNPGFIDLYAIPEAGEDDRKFQKNWVEMVTEIAKSFIRVAKDLQATPNDLEQKIKQMGVSHPLLSLGLDIYQNYQRALNYRGSVDFDDLVRLALLALQQDPDFLLRLRYRFPYILEDEAQDSSRLQEEILRLMVGPKGNWIRVGDPNQAIYESFTTASPEYLINFLKEDGVSPKDLSNSGRSSIGIINLANHLIDWTRTEHPIPELRHSLIYPLIQPSPASDPQPNPPYQPGSIYLSAQKYTPEKELAEVVKNVGHWIKENPHQTAAILVPRNERGSKVYNELLLKNIPSIEMLNSTTSTRHTARLLADILNYLDDPTNAAKLSRIYTDVRKSMDVNGQQGDDIEQVAGLIKKCVHLEDYLAPWPGKDWIEWLGQNGCKPASINELNTFRQTIQRWQAASTLRVGQLLLTISQDIFENPSEMALVHKLARVLDRAAQNHPEWRFPQLVQELNMVASNERRFLGFTGEDTGFDPDLYQGKVVVTTMHKAKGLEWDKVYLMSASNYDFPSAEEGDSFISEKWFVRNRINLPAEAISRLKALVKGDRLGVVLEEGPASMDARFEYAAERLRLFYVGITRARKGLVITWNTGKRGESKPSLAFSALYNYWKNEL